MNDINAVAAMKTYSVSDDLKDREDVRRAITTYQNTCGLPLHVFDDNSCPSYCEYLAEFKGIFLHTHGENVGPTENSNRCLSLFRKYHELDALILLDDDTEFLKSGWAERYLDALSDEVQILSFNDPEISNAPRIPHGDYTLSQCSSGVCVTLTRHCWARAGVYGPFPEKYGWCHIEYYWRCATLGLVPLDGFYDVPGIEEYLRISSTDHGTTEKLNQAAINASSERVTSTKAKYDAMRSARDIK